MDIESALIAACNLVAEHAEHAEVFWWEGRTLRHACACEVDLVCDGCGMRYPICHCDEDEDDS